MDNEKLKEFCQQMIAYRLPRWQDLPTFDIYMDQLITLVKQYLKDLFDEEDVIITSSMINNYVKAGLIPKPEKKRYHAQHIASLIAITLLKQVLSISQIDDGISFQLEDHSPQEAYDRFCDEQEKALKMIASQVLERQMEQVQQYLSDFHADHLAVRLVTLSFASALSAKKMMALRKGLPETEEQ